MTYVEIANKEEKSYNLFHALKAISILSEEIIAEASCIAYNFEQAMEILSMIENNDADSVNEAFDYITRYD